MHIKYTVIVPVFNEEDSVDPLSQDILETMDQIDGILEENLNESWAQIDGFLNRLFVRVLVLVAILGAVVLILGFFTLRALKS